MRKVLIVDDSLTDRKIISSYLLQAGLTIASVESAEDALEQMRDSLPNLIVLDVVMGGKSGFELCRKLKADSSTRNIPIVICSSKSTKADKMLGQAVGADAYVTKPVDPTEFMSKVQQLVA